MKKIINGKRYDTDTATHIANASSNCGKSDFGWFDEDLYKTPRGRFFLAGEGHAMTRWATPLSGNGRGPGSGIIPLSQEEAREWCERYDVDTDVIEKYFDIEEA